VVLISLWAWPVLASAADLVVGVVHDTDGYAVAGATVTLATAGGSAAGSGTTAADGTFAVDPTADVATVAIRCAYCQTLSVPRVPGRPVVVLVHRFAALRDRGISAADARVLPYGSVRGDATLMPFTVSTYGWLSDRGLAGGLGTVLSDGFALYRSTDGVDLGMAIPLHATATIQAADPAQTNVYPNSAGGLFLVDTLDQSAGLARVDASSAGDLTLRAGNTLRGMFATSGGPDAESRAVLDGSVPAAGGTLDVRALDAAGLGADATAVAATLTAPAGGATLTASASLTRSVDANGPENDDVALLALRSGAVTYGVRAARTSGVVDYGRAGTQDDARAYVEAAHDDGRTRLFASLTAAQSGESYAVWTSAAGALLPALTAATRLGTDFTLHADSLDALIDTPLYVLEYLPNGTAVDRSHLTDAGLGFDDSNRLHIDAMVFRQTVTGSGYGTTGGSGISTIWQIAPALALRTWTLISHDNGGLYAAGLVDLDRSSTWLTAGNVLRVDAIWRGANLEGDVSLPLGTQARFVAGTRRDGANRVVTAGVSWP
jgi:hypothetical protein